MDQIKRGIMKNIIFSLSCLLFLWACSTKDDVVGSENDAGLGVEHSDSPFVEILSVDSCVGFMDPANPNMGVDTFYVKKNSENIYSIRILTNLQCPPAESPDQVSYSYNGDTLVIGFEKKNPSFDVLCACMTWVEILVKHEIDFDYIQSSAIVYAVKKDY